ncbi:Acetamidase [Rasamsonia emersonii CBS 393.64]|uniref:amidase n=1 Tax=Rasamsonia emersonii (strain ATCC 16479 / CBS 393.64 / IMI 116815) TaxID=1408163 RepID=A0A0F4Z505_RASE3|nr:Acetamidase [Rasamsonia emersonii CBS 393.64]KKA24963.1 Acetamidase [Rasamsonia emersonii CBS 393.64]
MPPNTPPWQERARAKQAQILADVPPAFIHTELTFSETDTQSMLEVPRTLLSPLEQEITSLKAEDLVAALVRGQYTAVQVLDAFTHRAAIAHRLLNCCLQFCYRAARARAEELDSIIGRTSNPYNRSFSCGGSSGGEGALLAFRGGPMGVGTDLGGSIRSPSAYQGLWGLRPSTGRFPYHRMRNSCEGQGTIPSVVGPMTHSPASLELFAKTVVDSQPWLADPKCLPIPWRDAEAQEIAREGRKLRIGIMHWDKLRIFSADANGDIERTIALSQEPGLEMIGKTNRAPLTILESWDLAVERTNFQAAVLQQWAATASAAGGEGAVMDAYIAPVNPSICPKHGDYSRVRYLAYVSTVNLLDLSACTVPWTFVDKQRPAHQADDPSGERDAAGNPIPAPTCDLDRRIRANYDPVVYDGLPVTVQVVARKLEEEKVIAIAKVLERLRGGQG